MQNARHVWRACVAGLLPARCCCVAGTGLHVCVGGKKGITSPAGRRPAAGSVDAQQAVVLRGRARGERVAVVGVLQRVHGEPVGRGPALQAHVDGPIQLQVAWLCGWGGWRWGEAGRGSGPGGGREHGPPTPREARGCMPPRNQRLWRPPPTRGEQRLPGAQARRVGSVCALPVGQYIAAGLQEGAQPVRLAHACTGEGGRQAWHGSEAGSLGRQHACVPMLRSCTSPRHTPATADHPCPAQQAGGAHAPTTGDPSAISLASLITASMEWLVRPWPCCSTTGQGQAGAHRRGPQQGGGAQRASAQRNQQPQTPMRRLGSALIPPPAACRK